MDLVPEDKKCGLKTPIWDEYKQIVAEAEGKKVHGIYSNVIMSNSSLTFDVCCRSMWSCWSDLLSMKELSRHLL